MAQELCFIWGPPHCGQLRWMARSVQESLDPGVQTTLMPLKDNFENEGLSKTLQDLETQIFSKILPGKNSHHIYCELPWSIIDEDYLLEEKISEWLANPRDEWNLSFIAMVPYHAELLPKPYRVGLEEFSRASSSALIVGKRESEEKDPIWLGNSDILDFGRNLEVFEDPLWPLSGEMTLADAKNFDFSNSEDNFENLELPLARQEGEKNFYRDLLIELSRGTFGQIWGAEIMWRPEPTGPIQILTLTQGKVFTWKCEHPSIGQMCVVNGARLTLSGQKLDRKNLQTRLMGNRFFS